MADVTVRDLRNRGGAILNQVETGTSFVVTRDGDPVALLSPLGRKPVSRDTIIKRFKNLPAIDSEQFRKDIDAIVDQAI